MSFIRKHLSLSIISTAICLAFAPLLAHSQNAAIVNGKAIPSAQLDALIKKSGQGDDPKIREQGREMLITRELILQEADKTGVAQRPDVREQIEQSKTGVLVAAVFQEYIEKEGVTEADLKSAYESMKTQYSGKEYHVEHILVEKEADAKAIIAQIKGGAKFADIAKAKSKDPGSAPNGGDLGWVSEKALVPEFSKAMVGLKNGQMTDKPVKTQFGWHIIKVDESREAKVPSFDEVKDQLKQMIISDEAWQKAQFAEMMKKLRAKTKIQ